ncbi:MAG: hypothetical protein R3Y35_14145 [Clostridia bacterium]
MKEINRENKERIVVWLRPNIIERMRNITQNENMKNDTEFVEQAVDFYIGYLNSQTATNYLSEMVQGTIKGTLQSTENKTANNLFRLAVEVSVMMNIMAYGLEISDEQLRSVRARCIEEIKRNSGRVALEDAIEHQRS